MIFNALAVNGLRETTADWWSEGSWQGLDSVEVLSQQRTLNCLNKEARSLPCGSPQRRLLESQARAMHDRLPTAISDHYDRMARLGKVSLVWRPNLIP
jgi:hypothetical protein